MTRTAWFNCFSGIAGDMALGSLVDAGADVDELERILERLPIGGWSLEFEDTMRNGLGCTRAVVEAKGDSVVRTWLHIQGILEEARLPEGVRERAISAFSVLADAEGRIHRRPRAQVHFHEVGGHDTIVDIVGSAAALELLNVHTVSSGPVATGTGVVRSRHGLLPNPAPAVVDLLSGIPTVGRELNVELTTPTGAAILKAWGSYFGPLPAMTIEATGYGAGTREMDGLANCTQVVIGEALAQEPGGVGGGQPLVVLESNVDDATGETLANAIGVLMDEGALDCWVTPVVMKKGRPGHVVCALADVALTAHLAGVLQREIGSLGVRSYSVERRAAVRQLETVEVEGLPVRVKVSPGRIKAEHADVARVAKVLRTPLIEVAARAEAAWRFEHTGGEDEDPEPFPTPA